MTNEWVKRSGEHVTMGITKKAAEELDGISFIQFPEVGSLIKEGEVAVIIESTKAAIDISFPVGGRVIEVNQALLTNPSLLLLSPEEKGWLLKCATEVSPSDF